MTDHADLAAKLPQSFDGNAFLYASSLASLLSIACLGIAVCGWMLRDTWRDRYTVHPRQILFNFRMMIAIVAFTSFVRCIPEVLYLQAYNDKDLSHRTIEIILTAKRIADTFALPLVTSWMLLLVAIYTPMVIALKQPVVKNIPVDRRGTWPRLVRPFCLFIVIVAVSLLTAYSKVYGG